MKTIGIDCRLGGIKHAGIGRYIEELVHRAVQDESVNWVLFFGEPNQLPIQQKKNIKIVIAPIRHYSVAEQLRMPAIFSREKLDLLHVPHYNVPILYRGKFIVTIHDLLWHDVPNAQATTLSPIQHALKYQAYRKVVEHAVRSAAHIIVPAKLVRNDVVKKFPGLNTEKISVTYEGANKLFSKHFKIPQQEQSKNLFYTGSLYPHKNVMFVVHALRKLPDYHLYISSSRSVFTQEFMRDVSKLSVADRVHHLGRLSDEELITWYHKSAALIQPSTSEGFGLTGIEAMAAGLPVIASDVPIFHEIYGSAFISFDPHSIESLVSAVKRFEGLDKSALANQGRKVSAQYSWDTMADQTRTIYQSVCK